MYGRSLWLLPALCLAVFSLAGCEKCCHRPSWLHPCCPQSPCASAVPGQPIVPGEPRPIENSVVPSAPLVPQGGFAPPSSGPETRGYEPFPPQYTWRPPANGGARFGSPQFSSPEPPRASVPGQPGASEQAGASPALRADLPQFAIALQGVASGLKPFPDGLTWLKNNGYTTVLHLRAPNEDDTAEHREIEKRGLKYLSLDVSPATLRREVVDGFSQLVNEPANLRLYVYDRDGTLAGGLWYLYFRTRAQDTDEVARLKAARLGLPENTNGEMWLAIQKYLAKQPR